MFPIWESVFYMRLHKLSHTNPELFTLPQLLRLLLNGISQVQQMFNFISGFAFDSFPLEVFTFELYLKLYQSFYQ